MKTIWTQADFEEKLKYQTIFTANDITSYGEIPVGTFYSHKKKGWHPEPQIRIGKRMYWTREEFDRIIDFYKNWNGFRDKDKKR